MTQKDSTKALKRLFKQLLAQKEQTLTQETENCRRLKDEVSNLEAEVAVTRENFERERESLLDTIGKQKNRLKKLEGVREILDSTRGGSVREFMVKIEENQREIEDLYRKLDEKEEEVKKLREFYQRATFIKVRKGPEGSRNSRRPEDRSPSPQLPKGALMRSPQAHRSQLQR